MCALPVACPYEPWQRGRRPIRLGWAVSISLHQLPLGASALDPPAVLGQLLAAKTLEVRPSHSSVPHDAFSIDPRRRRQQYYSVKDKKKLCGYGYDY